MFLELLICMTLYGRKCIHAVKTSRVLIGSLYYNTLLEHSSNGLTNQVIKLMSDSDQNLLF